MEFKGTKGKWEIVKDDFFNSTVVKHKAFSVCVVNNLASNDICQANALLISKAPEMLKELINEVEILKFMGLEDTERCKRKEQLIKQATEL